MTCPTYFQIRHARLTFLLYIGYDLYATASSPNHSNTLSFQRVPLFVRSGMHKLALVVFKPRDIRPFPVVQNSSSVDKELCFIIDDSGRSKIADPELPDTFRCVPLSVLDPVLQFDVFVDEIVLFVDAF